MNYQEIILLFSSVAWGKFFIFFSHVIYTLLNQFAVNQECDIDHSRHEMKWNTDWEVTQVLKATGLALIGKMNFSLNL